MRGHEARDRDSASAGPFASTHAKGAVREENPATCMYERDRRERQSDNVAWLAHAITLICVIGGPRGVAIRSDSTE
jgi:hypothetical protein